MLSFPVLNVQVFVCDRDTGSTYPNGQIWAEEAKLAITNESHEREGYFDLRFTSLPDNQRVFGGRDFTLASILPSQQAFFLKTGTDLMASHMINRHLCTIYFEVTDPEQYYMMRLIFGAHEAPQPKKAAVHAAKLKADAKRAQRDLYLRQLMSLIEPERLLFEARATHRNPMPPIEILIREKVTSLKQEARIKENMSFPRNEDYELSFVRIANRWAGIH